LPLADFVPIAAQILKAVGYAHDRGLMHRDLKPSNIMLCVRQGRANFVKILDFGMAKLIEGERDITSEQIVGTANYLAPEQIRGEALDARVDVYAIGITFYALLAGRLPFMADNNAALLYKHVHEPPPPLGELLPPDHDVPPGLIALIHRCLAKAVDERPADANEIVRDLVACVPGELFHLPVAEGGSASPSSSYAVLPQTVAAGPDDLSGQLTRPVQALRGVQIDDAEQSTARRPIASVGGRAAAAGAGAAPAGKRPRLRAPIVAQRPVATAPVASPLLASPPDEGGKLWIGVAAVVLVGLLGLAGYLLNRGAVDVPDKPVAAIDERRLIAALDQIELDISHSNLSRARTGLAEVEPRIPTSSGLRGRADAARRSLDIAETLEDAQRLEAAADRVGAQSRYRDVLTLDPGHAGARAAIERLSRAAPPAEPITVPKVKPTRPPGDARPVGEARPDETKPAETPAGARAVDRPVEGPVEVPSPDASEPTPGKPGDGPVFLPTDK
ncbi:MAG: protein kinase, partial [Myxococcales bacterium]|nr:protein kinase [Myxococcales bacterium]